MACGGATKRGRTALSAAACLPLAATASSRVTTSRHRNRSTTTSATSYVRRLLMASIAVSSAAMHCASVPFRSTTPGGSMSTRPPPAATPTTSEPAGAGGVTASTNRPWCVVTDPLELCRARRSLASAAERCERALRSSGEAPSLNPPWSSTHARIFSATSAWVTTPATTSRSGWSSGGGAPFSLTPSTVLTSRVAAPMNAIIAASSSPPRDANFSALNSARRTSADMTPPKSSDTPWCDSIDMAASVSSRSSSLSQGPAVGSDVVKHASWPRRVDAYSARCSHSSRQPHASRDCARSSSTDTSRAPARVVVVSPRREDARDARGAPRVRTSRAPSRRHDATAAVATDARGAQPADMRRVTLSDPRRRVNSRGRAFESTPGGKTDPEKVHATSRRG